MKKSVRRKSRKSLGREALAASPAPPLPRQHFSKLFPVVGVGASAGGLEAFSTLVANLPQASGMAFILVQHLDPSHGSALEEILSRKTRIPVREVADGMPVEPNHVYVMPPNVDMFIKDGVLRLSPRTVSRGQHHPIDTFLRSLAEDCGDRAISVILSGTASDGTSGSKSVKEVGGITFAQDEASAKYESMPASAVAAGCIDFVLPPKEIAEELSRIAKLPYVRRVPPRHEEPLGTQSKDGMQGLFAMLRQANGVDFSLYKQSTLQRRVKRRMVVNNVEKLDDYVRLVKKNRRNLPTSITTFSFPLQTSSAIRPPLTPCVTSSCPSSARTPSRLRFASGFPVVPPAKKRTPWPSSLVNSGPQKPKARGILPCLPFRFFPPMLATRRWTSRAPGLTRNPRSSAFPPNA